MGIKKDRFVSPHYDVFVCPKCCEVVEDPLLVSCCDTAYCRTCLFETIWGSCLSCGQNFEGVRMVKFKGRLDSVYQNLEMRCDCGEVLSMHQLPSHNCIPVLKDCPSCGYKGMAEEGHDCVLWLKLKMCEKEQELEESKKQEQQLIESNNFLMKKVEDVIAGHKHLTEQNTNLRAQCHCLSIEVDSLRDEKTKLSKDNAKLLIEIAMLRSVRENLMEENRMLSENNVVRKQRKCKKIEWRPVPIPPLDGGLKSKIMQLARFSAKKDKGGHECSVQELETSYHSIPHPTVDIPEYETYAAKAKIKTVSIDFQALVSKCNLKTYDTPHRLIFEESETFAPKETRERIESAIFETISINPLFMKNMKKITEMTVTPIGSYHGRWYISPRKRLNEVLKFKLMANTFCSFSFDKYPFLVFRRGTSNEYKSQQSSYLMNRVRSLKYVYH